MKAITRLILSVLIPWGSVGSISSLAGKLKPRGGFEWLPWSPGESFYDFVSHLEDKFESEQDSSWAQILEELAKVSIDNTQSSPDDRARYFNNLACAAYSAYADISIVKGYLKKAEEAGATEYEFVKVIENNRKLF